MAFSINPEICCLEIENVTGGLFGNPSSFKVNAIIKNPGSADCLNVYWEFIFIGKWIFLDSTSNGFVNIPASSQVTVSSNLVIGLTNPGIVTVTVNAPNNACHQTTKIRNILLAIYLWKIY